MKKRRILMLIIFIIIFLLIVAYFLIGNYFYNIALNPNTSKTFVLGEPAELTEYEQSIQNQKSEWLEEKSEDVYITSGKLKLHSYKIINETTSNNWVIVVHGYMGEGKDMISQAKQFYERGYNVLVVDLRGHGKSEGDYIGMGWPDRLDLINWANYIIEQNNDCKIVLYGVSMGAATVMMATGEELPENIKVAIEDCGYSSIWEQFKVQLKTLFNLPTFPVLNAANAVCSLRADYRIKDGDCTKQVEKSKTPTLFIHGDQDKFVPFKMLDKVYEVANCEKQKLVIEGAAHAQASGVNPELYWKTIDEFVQKYL